ncbi:hypothetical protein M0802_004643 [Mischocyttarus mexicanus]|nr:hypothetical protein M0802_004643 [Mischocyttarus mexicanus]
MEKGRKGKTRRKHCRLLYQPKDAVRSGTKTISEPVLSKFASSDNYSGRRRTAMGMGACRIRAEVGWYGLPRAMRVVGSTLKHGVSTCLSERR